MKPTIKRKEEDVLEQGFYFIPDQKVRKTMSPDKLAIELSKRENDSPAYILLQHELQFRLATIQAKATRTAGWYGLVTAVLGALVTFFLGYYLGTSK